MKYYKISILLLFAILITTKGYSQCEGFSSYPEGVEQAKKVHVMYRDYMKEIKRIEKDKAKSKEDKATAVAEIYPKAFEKWEKVNKHCPGASEYHPLDGIAIYTHKAKNETDKAKQAEYHNKVLELYDAYIDCFGQKKTRAGYTKEGDLLRKKATYMQYKAKTPAKETFDIYRQSIEKLGDNTRSSVISPYVYLAKKLFKSGDLTKEQMRDIFNQLHEIADHNIEKENNVARFKKAKETIDKTYEPIEYEVFDCAYFKAKFEPDYEQYKDDMDYLKNTMLKRLKKAQCEENDEFVTKVIKRWEELRNIKKIEARTPSIWARIAYKEGNYEEAIRRYEEAITHPEAETSDMKADFALKAAKIAFAKLKDFPRARTLAEQASSFRPNWGEPHLLIGNLYASSGPLCGSGTGFNSQRVTWVAIDEWRKAKKVDNSPAVQEEADRLIRKYTQYMPTKEDIFQNPKLNVGDSYFVPCWIQRSTVIRGI